MPTLDISEFGGRLPKVSPVKIPPRSATQAKNIRTESGDLEPVYAWSDISASLKTGVIDALFLYAGGTWFNWTFPVSAINSPVAQDDYGRVYFTGDGVPKVTSNLIATGPGDKPAAAYTLGIPAPDTAPTGTVSDPGTLTDPVFDENNFEDDESRAYVVTYVTEYGEEGPPSPVSVILEIPDPRQTVDLTLPVPASNTSNIDRKRIYRTATTGSGTDFQLVDEVPLAQTAYTDSKDGDQLGLALSTGEYVMPPSNMQGLTMMVNGIVAGFAGNELCFSEPFLPYAWPLSYRRSTEDDIVAIAVTSTSLVVATKGKPYIFTGISPDAMSEQQLELNQACVSARSMVDMGPYVIYASPDGLVAVAEGRQDVITKDIHDKRTWAAYEPETIHAYHSEGKYIGFYGDTGGTGNGTGGFIFYPETGDWIDIDYYATAGFNDVATDSLYLVERDGGVNGLKKWEGDTLPADYVWRSKKFKVPDGIFAAYQVYTDDPANAGFSVYVDGVLVHSAAPVELGPQRLPDTARGEYWEIELTGSAKIERVVLADSADELP